MATRQNSLFSERVSWPRLSGAYRLASGGEKNEGAESAGTNNPRIIVLIARHTEAYLKSCARRESNQCSEIKGEDQTRRQTSPTLLWTVTCRFDDCWREHRLLSGGLNLWRCHTPCIKSGVSHYFFCFMNVNDHIWTLEKRRTAARPKACSAVLSWSGLLCLVSCFILKSSSLASSVSLHFLSLWSSTLSLIGSFPSPALSHPSTSLCDCKPRPHCFHLCLVPLCVYSVYSLFYFNPNWRSRVMFSHNQSYFCHQILKTNQDCLT